MPITKTTRAEILRSAWRVFHARGYKNTSLQQLADAAGLGKAGLLHHFGSKAGLMTAVLDFALNYYEHKILALAEGEGSVSDRLERILRGQAELARRNGGGGCFFGNMSLETGGNGAFSDALRAFHDRWTTTATRLLSERYSAAEAHERAYRLFVDYQGSVMLYKIYGDPVHLERLIERTRDSLTA